MPSLQQNQTGTPLSQQNDFKLDSTMINGIAFVILNA